MFLYSGLGWLGRIGKIVLCYETEITKNYGNSLQNICLQAYLNCLYFMIVKLILQACLQPEHGRCASKNVDSEQSTKVRLFAFIIYLAYRTQKANSI